MTDPTTYVWDAGDPAYGESTETCPACRGSGTGHPSSSHIDCPCCDGEGIVPLSHLEEILAELSHPIDIADLEAAE